MEPTATVARPTAAHAADHHDAAESLLVREEAAPATIKIINGRRAAIGPLLALLLLVNLAASLYQLPLNRVIERRLCRDYFRTIVEDGSSAVFLPNGQVREELCKVDPVQRGLARIQRSMDLAWIIGDLVMTIPLGFVAERYGRRSVLLLNLVPRLAMPAWAVAVGYFEDLIPTTLLVVAPILSFMGGDCVFNSLTYALAAGFTDDSVLRASYFGYMSSITYVVALAGPALASATMSILIWLPFVIGIILLLIAVRVISLLPDSLHPSASPSRKAQLPPIANFTYQTATRAVVERFRFLADFTMSCPRNFGLLLISMFLTSLASADTKLLVQYISKRYGWTFAAAGYLLSAKAVVNLVLLSVVVPALLRARSKRRTASAERANLVAANFFLVLSALGAVFIGVAWTIWVLVPALLLYAMGSALPVFTLSLLKSHQVSPVQEILKEDEENDGDYDQEDEYDPDGDQTKHHGNLGPSSSTKRRREGESRHDTTVFSIVMLVKAVGSLVGVPIVTSAWIWGIGIGSFGLGLPYFVSAACYILGLCVLTAMDVV